MLKPGGARVVSRARRELGQHRQVIERPRAALLDSPAARHALRKDPTLRGGPGQCLIDSGEKLLEVQVAKAFGISRSPARLALRALCDAKIVSELDGRGYQIVGRPKPEHMGRVAKLQELQISPRRQWERVFEKVEHEIRVRVLFGSLRIIEAPLAEHFHVSRTVARDVLGRMQSIGLVSKHGGHWIAERVSTDRIRHLFEMRMILEPEAMRLAAPLIRRPDRHHR